MRTATILSALGLALIGLAALFPSPGLAEDQTVDVGNLYFCAPSFEGAVCDTNITAGDTVTWNNSAGFHTVSGDGFDSGDMEPGNTFSFTFNTPGTYPYTCMFHPDEMNGRVIVAAQPTPTPTPAPTSPGATAAPATQPTTVTLPQTGGPPAGDATGLLPLVIAGTGVFLFAASGLVFVAARKN